MGNHLRVLSRSLSTSVARHQLVQPPVQVFGTEGRYATALFSAASKKKSLDVVEKDLKTFHATLKKDQRLADFLADPSIKRGLKAEGLASACDKLKMNELSKNLFLTLAENNRFSAAEAVVNSFVTAKALDANMKKEVDAALAGFLQKGQKSLVNYKVDPALIGGMVVSIGDKFVDMSMSSKLKKYSELIQAAA